MRHLSRAGKRSRNKIADPRPPQDVPTRALCLFRIRFLPAAAIFRAFGPFGGVAPQLAHIGAVLALSVTGHIGIELANRRVANRKPQEKSSPDGRYGFDLCRHFEGPEF